jgi:hypothetical protein
MWAQILNAILGLWLMAAPDLLGYGGIAADNDHVVGPLAASVAVIAIWQVTRPVRWANLALGAWLLIAPWVLEYERSAQLNDTIVGLLLIAFAAIGGKVESHRFGGGWSALWTPGDRSERPART